MMTQNMSDKYEFYEYEDILYKIIGYIPMKYYFSVALVNNNFARMITNYRPHRLTSILDLLPKKQCLCILRKTSKSLYKEINDRGFSPWYCMCKNCKNDIFAYKFDVNLDIKKIHTYTYQDNYTFILQAYTNKIEFEKDKVNRITFFYEMFCNLTANIWYMSNPSYKMNKFVSTIEQKLVELKENPDPIGLCLYNTFIDILVEKAKQNRQKQMEEQIDFWRQFLR